LPDSIILEAIHIKKNIGYGHGATSWNYGLKAKVQLFVRFIKYSFQLKNELREMNDRFL